MHPLMAQSPSPHDDYRHTLAPGEHEAFYFPFTTPKGDLFGFLRLIFAHDTLLEMIAVRLGGRTWAHQQRAPLTDAPSLTADASGPSLHLTCLAPWQRWRLRFQGELTSDKPQPATLDLTFTATSAPALYRFGAYHQAQQHGEMRGRVRIGAEERQGDLLAYRDHSWGVRPTGVATGWTVLNVPQRLYASVGETGGRTVSIGHFVPRNAPPTAINAAVITPVQGGFLFEDPAAGTGTWHVHRPVTPLVVHLGPPGHEEIRETPQAGDLFRDELGPAVFTSPQGEELTGLLEQARRLT